VGGVIKSAFYKPEMVNQVKEKKGDALFKE
jgi:hypothetical protein